jgi:pimeloyl-ACP methyl ester carboxylesterase
MTTKSNTKWAKSGDVRIAYEARGSGDPLLFVHGLGYERHGWGPLPDLLADDFEVIVFDNRGVGESDVPEGPYAIAQLAADAVAVLDAAGAERAHVLGVSLGGYVAQELALSFPRRVRKLVLGSTSPGGKGAFPMPDAGADGFARFPTMERDEGLRLMVENALGEHGVRERPELLEQIFAYRLRYAPTLAGWYAQSFAGATFDAYDRASSISASTLVFHGGADNIVDPRNAELLTRLIRNSLLHVIPDRGHLVMWEEAEALAPVVRDFLKA